MNRARSIWKVIHAFAVMFTAFEKFGGGYQYFCASERWPKLSDNLFELGGAEVMVDEQHAPAHKLLLIHRHVVSTLARCITIQSVSFSRQIRNTHFTAA